MKTKKLKGKQLGWMIAGGICVILLVVYLGVAAFFGNHFLFGTTVSGVNAAGKTTRQVEERITEEIDGYQINIEPRKGSQEVIKGADIALEPVFDGSLQKELKKQNGFTWPAALFRSSEIEVETMVDYNEESLEECAKSLEVMDESQMEKPQDALISEYSQEDGYKIIPEEEGTTVDEKKFLEALGDAILNLQDSISMEEADCYVKPVYTKDSKALKKLADTMNKYTKTSITYEFGDSQEVLDGKTISQWISVSKKQKAKLSQEKINEYVATLAENYNTAGKAKSLATSYGTNVTVSGGDYGWKIDQEKEAEAIREHIKNGETVSKEPAYSKTANSRSGNDYGDTYVEVNLTAQHLFYYKNGSLVLESDFVSGNDSKGWSTPAGAYGLYYKQKDKTLRGEDYATPVSFWMPFNGGVGFHDANWRSDFGGNYYKKSGSHGCVNLPYSIAKKLYENIDAGCAVLVYYLPGTESAKAQAQDAAAAVVQAIDALGEITLASKEAVVNARNQYDSLSDTAKGYVTNYSVLEAAEARIGQLEAEQAADQQAQTEAQPVIDAINQLAGKEITLDMKKTIENIRKQYDQLSEAARNKVTNYNILTEAENAIKELEKN